MEGLWSREMAFTGAGGILVTGGYGQGRPNGGHRYPGARHGVRFAGLPRGVFVPRTPGGAESRESMLDSRVNYQATWQYGYAKAAIEHFHIFLCLILLIAHLNLNQRLRLFKGSKQSINPFEYLYEDFSLFYGLYASVV